MRFLLLLFAAGALAAQDPNFDVQSRFVVVPVTVTTAKGKAVDGLDNGDFVLLDNGRRQKVVVDTIGTGVAPIALMIAVQSSGISAPVLEGRGDILGGFAELARLGQINTTHVLTQQTGGTTFSFTRQKGLEDAIEKLGGELHTQYVLGFTPDTTQAGYHRLEVQVTGQPKLRRRSRPGYWVAAARNLVTKLPSRHIFLSARPC